jgi:hypothetical protein
VDRDRARNRPQWWRTPARGPRSPPPARGCRRRTQSTCANAATAQTGTIGQVSPQTQTIMHRWHTHARTRATPASLRARNVKSEGAGCVRESADHRHTQE